MNKKLLGEKLFSTMSELVSFGYRYPGSAAEKRAAKYILEDLKEAGLDVTYEEYEARCYSYSRQVVRASCKEQAYEFESHPIWLSRGGPVSAPIYHAGYGTEPVENWIHEVEGKIVFMESKLFMTVFPTQLVNHIYRAAEDAGAVGFVAWVDLPCGMRGRYDEIHEDHYAYGKIPGAVICREDGLMVDDLYRTHGNQINLEIDGDGEIFTDTSGDIFGLIPGNEHILAIQTHYDSTHGGAVDNAAANAAWMHILKELKHLKGNHPTIMICGNSGHENCIGARHFMKRHEDLIARTYACINFDGLAAIGYSWSERGVIPTGRDDLRFVHTSDNPLLLKMVSEKLEKYQMLPANYAPLSTSIANEDLEGMFYDLGIPTLLIIGKPIWYHTDHDTPDKVEPEQLYRSMQCHYEIILEMLKMNPDELKAHDRKNHDEVVRALLPEEQEYVEECHSNLGYTFNIIPPLPKAGERVYMYQTSVVHDPGVIIDTVWDFGDGSEVGRGQFTSHVYENNGKKDLTVRLYDDKGNVVSYKRSFWIK